MIITNYNFDLDDEEDTETTTANSTTGKSIFVKSLK